jgi:hypothetical protein
VAHDQVEKVFNLGLAEIDFFCQFVIHAFFLPESGGFGMLRLFSFL